MMQEPVFAAQMTGRVKRLTSGRRQLRQHEVHVWLTRPVPLASKELLGAYERLLDQEETARCARFHFEADRHRYLATHAFLRATLSAYVDIDPGALRFVRNKFGRPELCLNPRRSLRFSLSKTLGLIA